jgi:hypothetical protein
MKEHEYESIQQSKNTSTPGSHRLNINNPALNLRIWDRPFPIFKKHALKTANSRLNGNRSP